MVEVHTVSEAHIIQCLRPSHHVLVLVNTALLSTSFHGAFNITINGVGNTYSVMLKTDYNNSLLMFVDEGYDRR